MGKPVYPYWLYFLKSQKVFSLYNILRYNSVRDSIPTNALRVKFRMELNERRIVDVNLKCLKTPLLSTVRLLWDRSNVWILIASRDEKSLLDTSERLRNSNSNLDILIRGNPLKFSSRIGFEPSLIVVSFILLICARGPTGTDVKLSRLKLMICRKGFFAKISVGRPVDRCML